MAKYLVICHAESCPNTNRNSKLSFFSFPLKQPKRYEKWLFNIKLKSTKQKYKYLCAEHFDLSCFTSTLRRRLLPEAVPIFQKAGELETTNFSSDEKFPKAKKLKKEGINAVQQKDWAPIQTHFPEHLADRTSLAHATLRGNAVPTVLKAFPLYLQKEMSSDFKDIPLTSIKLENSTNDRHFPPTVISSKDILLTASKSKSIPLTITNAVSSKIMSFAGVHVKTMKLENSSSTAFTSDEVILTTIKSENTSLDDDSLEGIVENNLGESEIPQTHFLNSVSKSKFSNVSHQINCVTDAEAFCAAETLLQYIINQDDVNKADINFILNIAQRIKDKLPIKKENVSESL